MHCVECGGVIDSDAKYCPGCGAKINSEDTTRRPDSSSFFKFGSKKLGVMGGIFLLAFLIGILPKDRKNSERNASIGSEQQVYMSKTGELNQRLMNVNPACPLYVVRQAREQLLQAREILQHEQYNAPRKASDSVALVGISILRVNNCI